MVRFVGFWEGRVRATTIAEKTQKGRNRIRRRESISRVQDSII
jgi:hypothetical protein